MTRWHGAFSASRCSRDAQIWASPVQRHHAPVYSSTNDQWNARLIAMFHQGIGTSIKNSMHALQFSPDVYDYQMWKYLIRLLQGTCMWFHVISLQLPYALHKALCDHHDFVKISLLQRQDIAITTSRRIADMLRLSLSPILKIHC